MILQTKINATFNTAIKKQNVYASYPKVELKIKGECLQRRRSNG